MLTAAEKIIINTELTDDPEVIGYYVGVTYTSA